MHGAANDFVVVDHRVPFLPPGEALAPLVARLCDRRRGVGADGVLLLEADPEHEFAMRYFNADGRPADFCGNGARCLARRALDLGLGTDGRVRFRTAAGIMTARRESPAVVALHFGPAPRAGAEREVAAAGRTFRGRLVVTGVLHFVTEVPDVRAFDVAGWGRELRRHPGFEPGGANVDAVARLGPGRVAMRTYERGVEGETLACGSGAMACALWAAEAGESSPVTVRTAGGDDLLVRFEPLGDGWDVTLTGPAEVAFAGTWDSETT
jgi:diaminopimelate epimerase